MGRGRGGSRTQRRHFRQNRENVWKRTKPDPSSENPTENNGGDPSWQPFATQSLAFEEYYKVKFIEYFVLFWSNKAWIFVGFE